MQQARTPAGTLFKPPLGNLAGSGLQPPQPKHITEGISRLREGANAIRARIKEERALYRHYLGHAKIMNDIEDLHGAWDANCNASEVSCRIDGLLFALEALGEAP
jgi:hypothetical protein